MESEILLGSSLEVFSSALRMQLNNKRNSREAVLADDE